MAYSADSFVADEQPTTAKWNKLWSNDASFNDGSGIGAGVITPDKRSGGFFMGKINANAASRVVTGVGFQPEMVEFQRLTTDNSFVSFGRGVSIGTTVHKASSATIAVAGTDATGSSESYSVYNITGGGTANVEGKVTAVGADGFTVTFDTQSNIDFLYVAYR